MKNLIKYLRELSIVVAGVAITLYGSSFLGQRAEKKSIAHNLSAIERELEDNVAIVRQSIEDMRPAMKYTEYLQSHDEKSMNTDTLNKYATDAIQIYESKFQMTAFEAFKNSGIMYKMKDRELLSEIWNVYSRLQSVKEGLDTYNEFKIDLFWKEYYSVEAYMGKLPVKRLIPMYEFFVNGAPESFWKPLNEILPVLTEIESKLERSKDLSN